MNFRHGGLIAFATILLSPFLLADGDEVLGPPSIAPAAGTGYVTAGVGLTQSQPGIINLNTPPGATINQVLLYWEGLHSTATGDDQITIDGNIVNGVLIGGPNYFFSNDNGTIPIYSSTYRANLTSLGIVNAGANALAVEDLGFDFANNGAGLIVIYSDGDLPAAELQLVDGNDLAYRFFPSPRDAMEVQTFTFVPSTSERTASISMFFSSVRGLLSTGGLIRPNQVIITVGQAVHTFSDELISSDGQEWDTFSKLIPIPPGQTQMTVEVISGPGGDEDPNTPEEKPASFTWSALLVSLPGTDLVANVSSVPPNSFYRLMQNYPNPFNPTTEISFELPKGGTTTLRILNMLGQELRTVTAGDLKAGTHSYTWDATDNSGRRVASGIYFYQLRSGNFSAIKKMAVLK